MSDYPILLREGTFHTSVDGTVCVSTTTGSEELGGILLPFEGRRMRIAAHHLPLNLNPSRWGGGSCGWESLGRTCPAGHHLRPSWIYNVSAEGILVKIGVDEWAVEVPDGSRVALDLRTNLPGHTGRVACALLASVEEMRDALGLSAGGMVDGLGARATDLRELMGQLQKITGGR